MVPCETQIHEKLRALVPFRNVLLKDLKKGVQITSSSVMMDCAETVTLQPFSSSEGLLVLDIDCLNYAGAVVFYTQVLPIQLLGLGSCEVV